MKISVDGGGLGVKKGEWFGNFVFSKNLIEALKKFDKKNQYFIYTFENLKPRFAWSKIRLSIEEFIIKKEVFLALNQAIPLYTSGKIISFCHGLSYYFNRKYYTDRYYIRMKKQLDEMLRKSDYIIVSSQKVKNELTLIKNNVKNKIVVIPFGVPFDMVDAKLPRSTQNNKVNKKTYFLFVGMNHPIKNINFIRKVFGEFKEFYKLKIITKNCSRNKLKKLYQNAKALLTASYYESFNLPVLEALSQGCPVIGLESAIIPELRSYINIAKTKKQFIELMKTIPKKPDIQLIKKINKKFSWKKYVRKLLKLY